MSRDLEAIRIFEQVIQLSSEEVLGFIEDECGDDVDLRNYVERLLSTQQRADDFLVADSSLVDPTFISTNPTPHGTSSVATDSVVSVGAMLNERYKIAERIGSGGMGEVFRAIDIRLERDVAIKVLNRVCLDNAEMQERFEREIKSVAGLSHPRIVTLYDISNHAGVVFAVMEFVDGKTVRQLISEGIQRVRAVAIASDVAAGLDIAHSIGLMHRDIKPENIIVSSDGRAKILDFGLARQEFMEQDQSLTGDRQAPGTPPYMSPEQIDSIDIGCPTDVFSLGTVLLEMLSGVNPFRAETVMATMVRISQQPLPDFDELIPNLPAELSSLLTAMLQRESEQRPTAAQVAKQLAMLIPTVGNQVSPGSESPSEVTTPQLSEVMTRLEREVPTNLPLRSAKLTGRLQEMNTIKSKLSEHAIVTIVGVGGVGKTSVAYQVAREVRPKFPGGVWLCELASLNSANGVLEVLTGVLDGNVGTVSRFEDLIARLNSTPTLLVFDNCEHVIDSAAELIEQLASQLPHLAILATSRESLRIRDEYVCRLDGLSAADAAELFTKRANAHGVLQTADEYDAAVEQIVTRLEGLPLSIELAAPKIATMSVSELLDGLDDQLAVLHSGRRQLDRQTTIDSAIAWSFDLLQPEEQQMLLSLSVFQSWFMPEAALEVSAPDSRAKLYLQRLIEQSVVIRREDYGRSRYRLLEPIRQFCRSRIEPEALAVAKKRHAMFYAQRANVLGRGVSGYDEIESLHALNIEWPDLREAIAWGRSNQAPEVAIDPIVALGRTAIFHFRLEAYQWLIAAEQSLGDAVTKSADACAMMASGYWLMGKADLADQYMERADQLEITSPALWQKYFLRVNQNRFAEAMDVWKEYEEAADANGDELELRWRESSLPCFALSMIDPSDERLDDWFESSQQRLSQLDWPSGITLFYCIKGVCLMRREHPDAMTHLRYATDFAVGCGNRFAEISIKTMSSDIQRDSIEDKREQLASTVAALEKLIDVGGESHKPVATRAVVLAMIACEQFETAVRCSAVVDSLRGFGDNDEFSSSYKPAMRAVREQLGAERFDELKQDGRDLQTSDVLELGKRMLGS